MKMCEIINLISTSGSIKDSAEAAKRALAGYTELYDYQRSIKEFGEERVIQEAANVIKNRKRCTYTEAYNEATNKSQALLELLNNEFTFREARSNLRH
jgi:predicted nucleic-acid-binding Zn-ribbon protein